MGADLDDVRERLNDIIAALEQRVREQDATNAELVANIQAFKDGTAFKQAQQSVAEATGRAERAETRAEAAEREAAALRHDIARHIAIASEQATEIEGLRAERDALRLRVAECEGALEPFTVRISERIGDDDLPDDYEIEARIPMREVRAARAAILAKEKTDAP